ncbi:galactose-3-O-sulfotransferase 2-like [Glandiceps talaboti]
MTTANGFLESTSPSNVRWKILIALLCVLVLGLYTFLPQNTTRSDPQSPQFFSQAMQKFKTAFYCEAAGVAIETGSSLPVCTEPVTKVVFIKTHKTASTTLASIIERYGYTRNLSFALGNTDHVLADQDIFTRTVVEKSPPPLKGNKKVYEMLTNHARYNRPEMDAVVPNARYITILREPSRQLESAFSYFRMASSLKLDKHPNALQLFMKNPRKFMEEKFFFWWQGRNGQLFDLGLDHVHHDDIYTVDYKIRQLEHEMDMVLITEYIDESLLLLRRAFCWEIDDILYISNNIRSKKLRYKVTDSLRNKILSWNSADVKLYEHFNRTLWRKIAEYGPNFQRDLQEFRDRQQEVLTQCVKLDKAIVQNDLEERYVLKENASNLCENLWRGDKTFTTLLREKQTKGRVLAIPSS